MKSRTTREWAIDEAGKICAWYIMAKIGDMKDAEFADKVIDLLEEIIQSSCQKVRE